jgi:hypothetical protein
LSRPGEGEGRREGSRRGEEEREQEREQGEQRGGGQKYFLTIPVSFTVKKISFVGRKTIGANPFTPPVFHSVNEISRVNSFQSHQRSFSVVLKLDVSSEL